MVDNTSASSGDHQQPLGVGLGRADLQQRDQFPGGGQPVLDEAVVRQLGQFLDPDSGVAHHLYHRPGPEPAVFFEAEITAPTAVGVLGPDAPGGLGLHHRPSQANCGGGEQLPGAGGFGGGEQFGGAAAFGRHSGDQGRQHRKPFAGAGIHPGLAT